MILLQLHKGEDLIEFYFKFVEAQWPNGYRVGLWITCRGFESGDATYEAISLSKIPITARIDPEDQLYASEERVQVMIDSPRL